MYHTGISAGAIIVVLILIALIIALVVTNIRIVPQTHTYWKGSGHTTPHGRWVCTLKYL